MKIRFDLFISYNTKDKKFAQQFAEEMRSRALRVFIDEDDLSISEPLITELENNIESSLGMAILIGSSGMGPWQTEEYRLGFSKRMNKKMLLFPILLPGAPDVVPGFIENYGQIDIRKGFKESKHKLDKIYIKIKQHLKLIEEKATDTSSDFSLHKILEQAKERIIISGHTIEKFSHDHITDSVIFGLISRGIKVTIIQLNENCRYAEAHQLYHEFESTSSAKEQHHLSLISFENLFQELDTIHKRNFEVLLSSYMPRFRTLIVDDNTYLFLYMYGKDVSATPDVVINGNLDSDGLGLKIKSSVNDLINAPETIPYIKNGQLFSYWKNCKLAKWETWTNKERKYHRITHEFYSTYATEFDSRFGHSLEIEIKKHLNHIHGKILVLGCGSGKEVDYLSREDKNNEVYGMDFSHVAIELARRKYPHLTKHFFLGNFYDLDWLLERDDRYNGIVANAAFVHLYKRNNIEELLKSVWKRLEPGGFFFLRTLYKERNGKRVYEELDESDGHRELWPKPRWFVYYSVNDLIKYATETGFNVLKHITEGIACEFGLDPKMVLEKGFRHINHENVWWPILILQKRVE